MINKGTYMINPHGGGREVVKNWWSGEGSSLFIVVKKGGTSLFIMAEGIRVPHFFKC